MRPTILTLALLLGFARAATGAEEPGPDTVQSAKSFKTRISRTVGANYLLFLPKDYRASGKKTWPLIFFLHGAGERGTHIWKVSVHGPPRLVKQQPDFPFIVLSPQCPAGQRWDNETLIALLDDVMKKHRVDKRRVYLTGLSMGGYGTWSLGLAYPERFAAIAPICGGGDRIATLLTDPKKAAALKSLGVWAFHGKKDPVVNLEESERMIAALRRFGCKEVELTVYPEANTIPGLKPTATPSSTTGSCNTSADRGAGIPACATSAQSSASRPDRARVSPAATASRRLADRFPAARRRGGLGRCRCR